MRCWRTSSRRRDAAGRSAFNAPWTTPEPSSARSSRALLLRFWIAEERTLFFLAIVPGLLAVVLLVTRIPERKREAPPPAAPADLSARLSRPLRTAIAIFALFTLANSTDAFLLLRARDCGVPVWQLPLLWAFFNGAKAAVGVPGGALSDRIGRIPTIAIGWLIYTLSYAGLAFAAAPLHVWALFGFYALFFAATEGAERALVADLAGERMRGRAFGAFHASVGLAALPASILFGLWWKFFGPRAAFLIGAAIALAATAALFLLRGRLDQRAGASSRKDDRLDRTSRSSSRPRTRSRITASA